MINRRCERSLSNDVSVRQQECDLQKRTSRLPSRLKCSVLLNLKPSRHSYSGAGFQIDDWTARCPLRNYAAVFQWTKDLAPAARPAKGSAAPRVLGHDAPLPPLVLQFHS